MAAQNFNLRGIKPKVMALLKKEASMQAISVNVLLLSLIESGVGYSHKTIRPTYHELDALAGTWSEKDAKAFKKSTEDFEKIDKDIWS